MNKDVVKCEICYKDISRKVRISFNNKERTLHEDRLDSLNFAFTAHWFEYNCNILSGVLASAADINSTGLAFSLGANIEITV